MPPYVYEDTLLCILSLKNVRKIWITESSPIGDFIENQLLYKMHLTRTLAFSVWKNLKTQEDEKSPSFDNFKEKYIHRAQHILNKSLPISMKLSAFVELLILNILIKKCLWKGIILMKMIGTSCETI